MRNSTSAILKIILLLISVLLACLIIAVNSSQATPIELVPEVVEVSETTAEIPVIVINDDITIEETTMPETITAPETTVEETTAAPTYSEEDLYYLTHVLTGECHTSPWEEQVAVGSVVLNRVADPEFPNTIKGVIEDRRHGIQYASFYDGNFKREATERNVAVAKYLLENGSQLPATVVYQSQRRQGSGTYVKINKHYFCYK